MTSNCREGALQILSFLIDDSGYGSAIDTYYSLKKFEKIDYYEIPDDANILYEAKKIGYVYLAHRKVQHIVVVQI